MEHNTTPLYERHLTLRAKMAPFAGFLMPIQYTSILQEHQAVREGVGIFDVSHMGCIDLTGTGAEKLLDFLLATHVIERPNGSAFYGVLCNQKGGCVDDVICLKKREGAYTLIVNASNKESDLQHILSYSTTEKITPHFHDYGILALQGPKAPDLLLKLFPDVETLAPMHVKEVSNLLICSTGYTGEKGFEIVGPHDAIVTLWDELTSLGATPCGLGARDTLRLEKGYALYGHELSLDIAPTESVSAWTVKFDKDFLGKNALLKLEETGKKRHAYGVLLQSKQIARSENLVFDKGEKVGIVTSGTYSPSLKQPIALVLVDRTYPLGAFLQIQVRDHLIDAEIVKLPFYKKEKS